MKKLRQVFMSLHSMDLSSFLYRRLSPWITCQFNVAEDIKIKLKNKYEVASFQDVFCHPFYWQIYQLFDSSPKLVVDCGAHCGHFTILVDLCLRSKFPTAKTNYILVEPNPKLLPILQKNLDDARLSGRVKIEQGLLGAKTGRGTLWVNSKNFLAAGLSPVKNARPYEVEYLDLEKILGEQPIDLIKIDIEGGEFDFVKNNLNLFQKVNSVFIEIHQGFESFHEELFASFKSVGLHPTGESLEPTGNKLCIFQR